MKRKISIFVAVIAALAMMSFTLMGNTGNDDAKETNGKNSCTVVVKYSSGSPESSMRVVCSVCGGISCAGNTDAVYTNSEGKAKIYWSEGCKPGKFTDSRDGKVYKTITIGTQTWMAENLAYTGNNGVQRHITNGDTWINNTANDGWCYYENNSSYASKYGVLYQWEAAKNACPAGWHLPSDEEWKTLERNLGMTATEANEAGYRGEGIGKKLKSATGWELYEGKNNGNNESGFSALPGGFRYAHTGSFYDAGKFGGWWSSTPSGHGGGWRRALYYPYDKVYRGRYFRRHGFSVRCVRD